MAPASGHLLVPKAVTVLKFALSKATTLLRSKLPSTGKYVLQPIRIPIQQHPTHPLAYLRQLRSRSSRFYSTVNSTTTKSSSPRPLRASLPSSTTARAVHGRGFTPFASPLRPSVSGTVGRTTLGGARNFTSGPTCHAQVLNNVSAAVRAFWLEGGRARYDGCSPQGDKRFKRVSPTQDNGLRAMHRAVDLRDAKGSSLRFRVAPTVTALSSAPLAEQTLGDESVLETLASDFARSMQDLAAVLADLKRLRDAYGDLPVQWEEGYVEVRFAGLDASSVERLADEIGVRRGVAREDAAWRDDTGRDVRMALLFPFAPSTAHSAAMSAARDEGTGEMFFRGADDPLEEDFGSPGLSTRSLTSADDSVAMEARELSWVGRSESGFASRDAMTETETESYGAGGRAKGSGRGGGVRGYGSGVDGYDGLASLYRFLAECDGARR